MSMKTRRTVWPSIVRIAQQPHVCCAIPHASLGRGASRCGTFQPQGFARPPTLLQQRRALEATARCDWKRPENVREANVHERSARKSVARYHGHHAPIRSANVEREQLDLAGPENTSQLNFIRQPANQIKWLW